MFHDALNAKDNINNIFFFDENFSKFTFCANQIGILGVDLDKINLDDCNNFDKDDPETTLYVRLLAWRSKCEKSEVFKKYISKELMSIVWHPTRCF